MNVGTNYSTPVNVNGFPCKNCTDVDYARKHIDPAHPRSGPYGVNAKEDPTNRQASASAPVVFGGSLGGRPNADTASGPADAASVGAKIDLSV